MTLSLYSTYKAWRRDVAAEKATAASPAGVHPLRDGVCHALVLFGMGVEGVTCGGDGTPYGRAR